MVNHDACLAAFFQLGVSASKTVSATCRDVERPARSFYFTLLVAQDLKIACSCLAHDATSLTRKVADFKSAPGLRIENQLKTEAERLKKEIVELSGSDAAVIG